MNGKSLLFLGIGAGALAYFGSKAVNLKQAIAKLTATNPKIKIAFQGIKIVLDITVDILNPGSIDIPFEYYTGIVLYDNAKIADFTHNGNGKNILLKGRSTTPLTFKVNVATASTIFKLVKVIKALSSQAKVDTLMAVQSSIYAAGFDVPINFVYDLKKQEVVSGIGRIKFFKKLAKAIPIIRLAQKIKQRRQAPLKAMQAMAAEMAPTPAPTYAPTYTPPENYTKPQPAMQDIATVAPVAVPHVDEAQNWGGN